MLDVTFGSTCKTCCVLPNFHQVGQWSLAHRAVSSRLPTTICYATLVQPSNISIHIYRYELLEMGNWSLDTMIFEIVLVWTSDFLCFSLSKHIPSCN